MQEFADDDNVGGRLELPFSTAADEDKEMYYDADATSDWDALNGSLHEPLDPGLHDEYSVPMMHDEPATELHSTLPHSVHGQVNAQPYAKREPKPVEPRAEQGTARTRAKEEQRLARESGKGAAALYSYLQKEGADLEPLRKSATVVVASGQPALAPGDVVWEDEGRACALPALLPLYNARWRSFFVLGLGSDMYWERFEQFPFRCFRFPVIEYQNVLECRFA